MKAKVLPFFSIIILLSVLLSACSGQQSASWPGITIAQDTTYVSYLQLYSIRTSDGSLQWKYPEKAEGAGMFALPAVGSDIVVVGDYSDTLHAVNPKTGALLWKFTDAKSKFIAPALVTDKLVLAPCADHSLYAIDFQGKLVAKFDAGSALWSQPLFDGKTLFQTTLGHKLFAFDPANIEKPLWNSDLGGAIVSTPLLDTGTLYVGTLAKEVVAVNSQDGKIIWRTPINQEVWSSPVIKDGTLYVASKTGTVYALNAADGKEVWKKDISSGVVTSKGAITPAGVVFVSVKDKNNGETEDTSDVVMLDYAKGTQIWLTNLKSLAYGDPVGTPDHVLVGLTRSPDKIIIALDLTGRETWSLAVPK
jgi:outer membrane protein assembly factor BamB